MSAGLAGERPVDLLARRPSRGGAVEARAPALGRASEGRGGGRGGAGRRRRVALGLAAARVASFLAWGASALFWAVR